MVDVLLHVPEQYAGNPITLAEAVQRWATLSSAPHIREAMTLRGVVDVAVGAWMWIGAGLASGAVSAFVQAPLSGRWSRLPQSYWKDIDLWADPPTFFDGISGAVGQSSEMVGQPIVIWEDGDRAVMEVFLDFCRAAAGSTERTAEAKPAGDVIDRKAEEVRVARSLDDEGIRKGLVRSHHVVERWNEEKFGKPPKVGNITILMSGQGKGGRKPGPH